MSNDTSLFERQMAMYTGYHRDPRNRATHFVGIPAIIVALLLALAMVELPLVGSLGVVLGVAVYVLWIALDRVIGSAMGLFLLPAIALAEWMAAALPAGTLWTWFGVLFVGGWILQIWGHIYEGKRPALISNLFQALIGPMFLMAEILFALGFKRELRTRIHRLSDHGQPAPAGQ